MLKNIRISIYNIKEINSFALFRTASSTLHKNGFNHKTRKIVCSNRSDQDKSLYSAGNYTLSFGNTLLTITDNNWLISEKKKKKIKKRKTNNSSSSKIMMEKYNGNRNKPMEKSRLTWNQHKYRNRKKKKKQTEINSTKKITKQRRTGYITHNTIKAFQSKFLTLTLSEK